MFSKQTRAAPIILFAIALSLTTTVTAQEVESATETPETEHEEFLDKFRFSGTESFMVEFVGDNDDTNEVNYGDDDNFTLFRNVLELNVGSKFFDSGVRIDSTFYQHPPRSVDPALFAWSEDSSGYTLLNYNHDFRVERVFGTVKFGKFEITAGDFYVTFGRGTMLALAKFDDLALDNALRGGRVDFNAPGKFKLIAVGGIVNAVNYDPFTHQILEDDPLDKIAGLRMELDAIKHINLAISGVMIDPRFNNETQINDYRIYTDQSPGVRLLGGGLDADMHFGNFSWYLEGSGQIHDNYRPPEGNEDIIGETGWAVFTETSYELPIVTLKGQGYTYRRWLAEGPLRGSYSDVVASPAFLYGRRYTLEPTWAPMKSLGNSSGGKLIADSYIKASKTQLVLAGAVTHYFGGMTPQGIWGKSEGINVVHPTLSVRQELGSKGLRVSIEGGFLKELAPADHGEDGELWHAMADASVPLVGRHSLKLRTEMRHHDLDTESGGSYWVSMNILGYDWAGVLGLEFIHEYSDQTSGMDGGIFGYEYFMPLQHYLQVRAEYFFPGVLRGLSTEVRAGSQRGGRKCTGGGCRTLPDAMGIMINTVYRF